ncbi:BCCT family transporter [Treponema parvum]|uniref:BCCT family transporter n=1 Tax=Treponema parvum TaxID=138851 RepID=A0A975F340_9SPIR|nr:BCCT family transporter [Treponema parvum]QTQ13491.1 BCCT family transporter [Treponema parvum]
MNKLFRNINLKIFIPSCLTLIILISVLLFFSVESMCIIQRLYDVCTEKFGWLYQLTCFACFGFLIWISCSKVGNIKLGESGEKPQYSDTLWIAMLFTAGVGTSIVILGFLEPIYYVSSPPFNIEPMSEMAYEYAHMYGQFHWGLGAWAFYNPAIIAVAYMMYVRKESTIRLSSACRPILKKNTDRWPGYCIDIFVIFGIVGSITTSLGIGTPVLANIIREVFGIPQQYELEIKMVILVIWVMIFGTSVFLGLEKGIQRLSNINIIMAFVFMMAVFLIGPTVVILKMEVNSLGLYISNFFRMSTYTQPFGDGDFTRNWTVFYWGWWIAFMPMMGMFVGKISRGRTIKNVVWGQLIWGTAGCCLSFMIFGGYSLYLQKSGKVDLVSVLNKGTQSDAIIAILKTLPMSRIMMIFLCVVCFIYLATTIDSCAYVLAGVTTDDLEPTKDPARWNRLFWAILFSILSIAIMVVSGIETVKIMSVVTGIFLILVLFLLMVAVKIRLEEDLSEKKKKEINMG